ncbi:hypothetical protein G5S34_08645 [Herbaspirillum frisingense]|uniref:hypothetical protein n=1 Tax=Herbaspirillum frisingense TaxID=92645 RepID=UPI0015FF4327|nr:hypothetical protein [Herbaspirillum frisingense]QNB06831.1 hypothetical protein G5S34_08645 [Herbaspirillum frisingense]
MISDEMINKLIGLDLSPMREASPYQLISNLNRDIDFTYTETTGIFDDTPPPLKRSAQEYKALIYERLEALLQASPKATNLPALFQFLLDEFPEPPRGFPSEEWRRSGSMVYFHLICAEIMLKHDKRDPAWACLLTAEIQQRRMSQIYLEYRGAAGKAAGNSRGGRTRAQRRKDARDECIRLLCKLKPETGWQRIDMAADIITKHLDDFVKANKISLERDIRTIVDEWLDKDRVVAAVFKATAAK